MVRPAVLAVIGVLVAQPTLAASAPLLGTLEFADGRTQDLMDIHYLGIDSLGVLSGPQSLTVEFEGTRRQVPYSKLRRVEIVGTDFRVGMQGSDGSFEMIGVLIEIETVTGATVTNRRILGKLRAAVQDPLTGGRQDVQFPWGRDRRVNIRRVVIRPAE